MPILTYIVLYFLFLFPTLTHSIHCVAQVNKIETHTHTHTVWQRKSTEQNKSVFGRCIGVFVCYVNAFVSINVLYFMSRNHFISVFPFNHFNSFYFWRCRFSHFLLRFCRLLFTTTFLLFVCCCCCSFLLGCMVWYCRQPNTILLHNIVSIFATYHYITIATHLLVLPIANSFMQIIFEDM